MNSITCISDPAHDQVETAGHDPDVDVEEADHEPNQVVQVECNMRIPKKIFDYMGNICFKILMWKSAAPAIMNFPYYIFFVVKKKKQF